MKIKQTKKKSLFIFIILEYVNMIIAKLSICYANLTLSLVKFVPRYAFTNLTNLKLNV
jgi:hypothetical protein